MRLAVVGDTRHYRDGEGRLHAPAAVACQLEQWASMFDELVLVVPLHPGPPPPGFRPYRCENVSMRPLRPAGGEGLPAKLGVAGRLPGWAWRLARALRATDAVHIRCPCNVGLVATLVAVAAFPRRHRYALYAGNWSGYAGEPWTYRLQRRLLAHPRFGGLVTVYSDRPPGAGHVVGLFSPTFSVQDWAAEAGQVQERLQAGTGGRPLRLVTVGALTANKSQADVVRAVGLLTDRGVDVRLEVVGDGPCAPRLARLVDDLGLAEKVRLCGRLDHHEVRRHYRSADLNLLASRTEGYPKVVAEGMAAGAVPVISDFPLARSLVGGGTRGSTFPVGDPDSLAATVAALGADPDRLRNMVVAGREYARTVTLDAYRDRIRSLLEQHWGVPLTGTGPVRVLHLLDALGLGGRERMAVDLANLLDPARFEVTVCGSREGGPMEGEVGPGVGVAVLGRRARWDLAGLLRFRALVRRRRIDVVHSHGWGPARMVALCKGLGLVRARHLFHDHASGDGLAGRGRRVARALVGPRVDAYVGVGDDNAAWAVSVLGLPPGDVSVVPNGVDLRRFDVLPPAIRDRLGLGDDDVVLVMVAGFRPEKDHPTVLRAVARARARRRIQLLLVGPRSRAQPACYDRCLSLAGELGIGDRVHMLGARRDVPAILVSADIGVLGSRSESGPVALAEYMAAGLPYVVTGTGSLAASVRGTGTGRIVPRGDPDSMAAAIDELVALPAADRRAMGERGRALARDLFDQRRVVDAVADVYRRLTSEPT